MSGRKVWALRIRNGNLAAVCGADEPRSRTWHAVQFPETRPLGAHHNEYCATGLAEVKALEEAVNALNV